MALALPGARADVFGFVIGIDNYGGRENLKGAVADARDVEASLRRIGAREVITLFDEDARRARIFRELSAMQGRARAGDVIVLHYAGHGAQEPLRPDDLDADGDGKNDDFVLGGFRTLDDPGERVIDKEIVAWLAETSQRGIKVLFVADSCHSGGMIRGTGPGVRTRKIEIAASLPPLATNVRSMSLNDPRLANVTFLAAVPRNRESPEIVIDGQPRGALSWAFARALEGAGSPAGARELTQAQLQRFVIPTVIALSEGQQLPQMYPPRGAATPLLPLAGTTQAAVVAPAQSQTLGSRELGVVRPVTLAIVNGPSPATAPRNARIVGADEAPDLTWDARARVVRERIGGVVAENVEAHDLDGIVAKWAAIALVKRAMGAGAPVMEIDSGVKAYGRGDEVRIRVLGARQPYLTIFNLPPNGRVELLYPEPANASEASADWRDRVFEQKFYVDRPPFGAEHLVAIFSAERQTSLHAALARMDDRARAADLPETLAAAFARRDTQVGIMPVYTTGK